MPSIELKVINPPSTSFDDEAPRDGKPLFRGNGDIDYVCGSCSCVIASGMAPSQHVIVDRTTCPACGAENEFPPELRA